MDLSFLVVVVIVTALVFDFSNGFHDTANAMATSIATGALRPKVAVGLSAVLNLVGAFVSTEVVKTISSGLVDDTKITVPIIFGGLVGAILWNLLTWYLGLPSSSSHALFGGLIGATWIAAGSGAVHINWTGLGEVALVSLIFGVGLAVVFALGVTAMARRAAAIDEKRPAPLIDTAVASLCFAACLAAVLYGLYLIIPQFH